MILIFRLSKYFFKNLKNYFEDQLHQKTYFEVVQTYNISDDSDDLLELYS